MEIKSSLVYPILKSFLPLLVGGSFHLLKGICSTWAVAVSNLNQHKIQQKFDNDEVQDHYQTSPEEEPSDSLSMLNRITFGIYTNFFAFLLVMLLIDAGFKIIQIGLRGFWKEAKSSKLTFDFRTSFSRKRHGAIYLKSEKQIMKVFVYAFIFLGFQITGLCFVSFSQSQAFKKSHHHEPVVAAENSPDSQMFSDIMRMNDDQDDDFRIPRILEEEKDLSLSENKIIPPKASPALSDKISLSMGNILSSLSLNVNEMILTKNKRIAYVTLDYYSTLKVIDISDVQSPFVIGSLNLEVSTYSYRIKNLLLSSDEKTLYASNSRELEIIDVTDPTSPKLISLTKSTIFVTFPVNEVTKYVKTSLAVEENTKTLYIGGMGLQVYDISDLKKPALLKAFKNELKPNYGLLRNELCLSHDGQLLFVANGTLDVHNISDPKEMKLLYSFPMKSLPRSLLLSEDGKTIFLVGSSVKNLETIFEEVDVSDLASLKIRNTIKSDLYSINSPRFVAVSPRKSKFFVLADLSYHEGVDLLIFDSKKQTVIKNEKNLIENTFALHFSEDGRTLTAASNSQFMTIELYFDYPNSRIFSGSLDNLKSNFSLSTSCAIMEISGDGKYLFILRREMENFMYYFPLFEIWDVEDMSKPKLLDSLNLKTSIKQMHFTKDYETVYLVQESSIFVLDIKNRSSIKIKKTLNAVDKKMTFWHFTTSPDEKTGFLIIYKDQIGYMTFFDLSESSPSIIQEDFAMIGTRFEILINGALAASKIIVKDDKTLILLNQERLLIYDISNLNSATKTASLLLSIKEPTPEIFSALLSPDQKTLYTETSDMNGFHKLRVYDVSSSTSPQLIGEKDLSKRERYVERPPFSLSADLKSGFIYQDNSLLRLNLTNSKDIKVSGIIPLAADKTKQVSNYVISPDGQTIYASIENQIRVLNMNIKYTIFLKQQKFLLGEKHSGRVALFSLAGSSSDYDLVDSESYKVIKMSLLNMKVNPNNASIETTKGLLPSWITFDSEGDILTVDAKKQRDIGAYTLHSAFSLKIPNDTFKDLAVSSRDLWAWLISLGYVDNQRFLTANFGSEDDFFLPEKFENYTNTIYDLLKGFYFETCTGFEIVSSLKFEERSESRLAISTLSTNEIKVEINLYPQNGSDVKFVSCPYGWIEPVMKNHNKARMWLEGNLRAINTALNSVVVNFENEGGSCDASIMINDGFNPTITMELTNISRYFKANGPPRLRSPTEKTVQEQIDSADIQTGKYFTFTLSNDIFEDENAESLSYELVMAKNGTAFPTWLSFNGLTLKGTPPQEVLGRDIDLILVAKNEFKQAGVPLTLHVQISLAFWLQLALKYAPYVLTIVGLLVSANKIWNILGKAHYKHFKEFYVGVGKEISSETIQPILFINPLSGLHPVCGFKSQLWDICVLKILTKITLHFSSRTLFITFK